MVSEALSSFPETPSIFRFLLLLCEDLQQKLSPELGGLRDQIPLPQTHILGAFSGAKIPEVKTYRRPDCLLGNEVEEGKTQRRKHTLIPQKCLRPHLLPGFAWGRLHTINASLQLCLGHSSHLGPARLLSKPWAGGLPHPNPVAGCHDLIVNAQARLGTSEPPLGAGECLHGWQGGWSQREKRPV